MLDKATRDQALRRLRRIEGQVKGIQRMVAKPRYCVDILQQIAAVQGALEQVNKLVLRRHLQSCVTEAFRSDRHGERERKIQELVDVFSKFS